MIKDKLFLYLRCIDDIYIIWIGSISELKFLLADFYHILKTTKFEIQFSSKITLFYQ